MSLCIFLKFCHLCERTEYIAIADSTRFGSVYTEVDIYSCHYSLRKHKLA